MSRNFAYGFTMQRSQPFSVPKLRYFGIVMILCKRKVNLISLIYQLNQLSAILQSVFNLYSKLPIGWPSTVRPVAPPSQGEKRLKFKCYSNAMHIIIVIVYLTRVGECFFMSSKLHSKTLAHVINDCGSFFDQLSLMLFSSTPPRHMWNSRTWC